MSTGGGLPRGNVVGNGGTAPAKQRRIVPEQIPTANVAASPAVPSLDVPRGPRRGYRVSLKESWIVRWDKIADDEDDEPDADEGRDGRGADGHRGLASLGNRYGQLISKVRANVLADPHRMNDSSQSDDDEDAEEGPSGDEEAEDDGAGGGESEEENGDEGEGDGEGENSGEESPERAERGGEGERERKSKKRKHHVGSYDYKDPFIDDAELEDAAAMAAMAEDEGEDAFAVYKGELQPRVPETQSAPKRRKVVGPAPSPGERLDGVPAVLLAAFPDRLPEVIANLTLVCEQHAPSGDGARDLPLPVRRAVRLVAAPGGDKWGTDDLRAHVEATEKALAKFGFARAQVEAELRAEVAANVRDIQRGWAEIEARVAKAREAGQGVSRDVSDALWTVVESLKERGGERMRLAGVCREVAALYQDGDGVDEDEVKKAYSNARARKRFQERKGGGHAQDTPTGARTATPASAARAHSGGAGSGHAPASAPPAAAAPATPAPAAATPAAPSTPTFVDKALLDVDRAAARTKGLHGKNKAYWACFNICEKIGSLGARAQDVIEGAKGAGLLWDAVMPTDNAEENKKRTHNLRTYVSAVFNSSEAFLRVSKGKYALRAFFPLEERERLRRQNREEDEAKRAAAAARKRERSAAAQGTSTAGSQGDTSQRDA
ncbi:unnamed protein product [Pedinophyceae sp. YPF-701]|nr:unnamed protein product [Pedinophyceae sp. YPF-701]